MKRFFLPALLLCLLLTVPAAAEVTAESVDARAVVGADGSYTMTVTAQLDITGTGTTLLLPVARDAKNAAVSGEKARTVTGEDGLVSLELENAAGFAGSRTVVITYDGDGLVQSERTGQLFQLELLSSQWESEVENVSFTVTMPRAFEAAPKFLSGYYGEIGNVRTAQQGQVLTGNVKGVMMDHESLTLELALPGGYFRAINRVSFQGDGSSTAAKAAAPVLLLLAILYWFFRLRTPGMRRPRHQTRPPDGVTAGEVPSILFGRRPDPAAQVFHWADSGYIRILTDRSGRISLRRAMAMGNERRDWEQKLFAGLFGGRTACDDRELRRAFARSGGAGGAYWRRRIYGRRRGGQPLVLLVLTAAAAAITGGRAALGGGFGLRGGIAALLAMAASAAAAVLIWNGAAAAVRRGSGKAMLVGLILLVVWVYFCIDGDLHAMALAVQVILILSAGATAFGGRRTNDGASLLRQLLGLQRFFLYGSPQTARQLQQEDPHYFYRMLPYAEAMNCGKSFVAKFDGMKLEPWPGLVSETPLPQSAAAFYLRFREVYVRLSGGKEQAYDTQKQRHPDRNARKRKIHRRRSAGKKTL